jgi:capsular exopolysaccharide synthesis family protein
MARSNDLKLISLASPSMSEGKTTTTANLAVALAHSGKRVIAVSCDLRKPRLHRFFDLTNERGVTNILMDGLTVPQVAQRVDGLDTLRVIASGPVPHNPAELLGSEEMEQLLRDLRSLADFVLIDTAPVLVVSDAVTLAPKTDGTVLVVDGTKTLRGAVQATREQLELVGANIVGAVMNNFDPSKAKLSYGSYRYHYYGNYSYHEAPPDAPKRRAAPTPVDPSEMWG